jgi:hypothetical protein
MKSNQTMTEMMVFGRLADLSYHLGIPSVLVGSIRLQIQDKIIGKPFRLI